MLFPKANDKIRLCLNPTEISEVLMRPNPRGPTKNDILPRVASVIYLMFINANSGYHNIRLDEQ